VALLTPPFLLGAAGQVMSGRLARLSLSATFRPAATGVQVVSGVLAGPPNTQGELALPSPTQLTVQAFRAVVQSALDATAGAYEVINDAQVTLAVTAQHASQFRRSLVVVRVDDSQVSGVASSSTTDRATLEILDGALAASSGATVLPTPAGSWLALGEVLIPPTGQTVTLTPYNPRTGLRGGILPVLADGSTVTGHDGAPGTAVGQYRDHPTYGLQRWDGTGWGPGAGSPKPTLLPLTAPTWTHYANVAGGYENVYLTVVGRECRIRGLMRVAGNVAANDKYTIVPVGGLPAAARPTGSMGAPAVLRSITCFVGNSGLPERVDILADGSITIGNFSRGYTAPWLAAWDVSWNVEGQPTT
jgi:hypothetical protein